MRHLSQSASVLILAALLFAPAGAFADAVLSVSSPPSVSQGDTFTVDVNIFGVTGLAAFQFDLGFDPSILKATGTISEGSFFQSGGGFVPGTIDNTAGTITFNANTLLGPGPGLDGSGTLMEFQFLALGPGTSQLDLANIFLLDPDSNSINYLFANGSVEVTGSGPVPTPEPGTLLLLTSALGSLALLTVFKRA